MQPENDFFKHDTEPFAVLDGMTSQVHLKQSRSAPKVDVKAYLHWS